MGEGWLSNVSSRVESGDKMNKRERQLRAEIRFLEPLVSFGETSTDAIPDVIADAYSDGGQWVGSIPSQYLRENLIVEIRTIRSTRPSRHKGKIGLFGAKDIAVVVGRIALLRSQLKALLDRSKGDGVPESTVPPAA